MTPPLSYNEKSGKNRDKTRRSIFGSSEISTTQIGSEEAAVEIRWCRGECAAILSFLWLRFMLELVTVVVKIKQMSSWQVESGCMRLSNVYTDCTRTQNSY
jgi:hypothetical protein